MRIRKRFSLICAVGLLAVGIGLGMQKSVNADANDGTQPVAYDLSQWQGNLTSQQANGMHREVSFAILRTQAGDIKDTAINHNEQAMDQAHVPYGVYSYSYYTSPAHAAGEADELYQRSPYANFYVNDDEEDDTNGQADQSAISWSQEMHRIDHHRPVVLYSNLSYMNALSPQARNAYDALWVADYSGQPDPSYHYDLWQNSRTHYSPALGQDVDSDALPYGARSLRYWTKNRVFNYRTPRRRYYRRPVRRRSRPAKSWRNRTWKKTIIKFPKVRRPTSKAAAKRDWKKINTAKYQLQTFGHLVNAVRRYPTLDTYQKAYVNTLWDWLCRDRPLAFKLMDCNDQYYCSPKLRYLTVKAKTGIWAYNFNDNRRVSFLPRRTRIQIGYFRYGFYKGMEITRCVAKYRGHWITFSTNKNVVY